MRVYIRHDYRMRIPSGIWVSPKRWGKKNGITIPATPGEEQETLLERKETLRKLTLFIENELKLVDDKSTLERSWGEKKVKAFYKPAKTPKEDTQTLFSVIDKYLNSKKLSESRIKHFRVIERCLKRYELYRRATGSRTFRLELNKLTHDLLADFEYFLANESEVFKAHPEIYKAVPYSTKEAKKTVRRKPKAEDGIRGMPKDRGQNYVSDIMARFRSFVIWANNNDLTTNNPFKTYSVGESVYGTPIYISNEERKRLYEADLSAHSTVAVQHDIFVFQCLIGNIYKQVKDPNLVGALSGHKEGSKAFARYRTIDDDMKKELIDMLG